MGRHRKHRHIPAKKAGAAFLASGGVGLAALGAVGTVALATAPDAAAAAGTYCSVRGGGCDLFAEPNTGYYYFSTGGKLPAGMLCWEDGQWTNLGYSTNRWFKMTSAAYGIFWRRRPR